MATILDVANCASPDSVFNTGIPLCDLVKQKLLGVILADKGVRFTAAETASKAAFLAALKAKATAPRGQRVYPIWDINNLEDQGGDPTTGSVGNLTTATIVTSDPVPVFRFGYSGSESRHKRLAAMGSIDVFFVDAKYAVYGTTHGDEFAGFSVQQAYTYPSKFIISDAVNQYSFRITLGSVVEYRDQSKYVVMDSSIAAAVGLVNAPMKLLSSASNVHKIQVIADGGTNLEPIYGTSISALTFTATNLTTSAAFTVTSVADSPLDYSYSVTLDSAAWTALASGTQVQINPPSASALATANVKFFEFLPVIVTKP
jgi:hypothetical protein